MGRPLVFATCNSATANCRVKSPTREGFELCVDDETTVTYMAFENRRPQTHLDNLSPFGYKLAGTVHVGEDENFEGSAPHCKTINISSSSNLDHAGYPTAPYPHSSISDYLNPDPGAGVTTILVSSGGDTDTGSPVYYVKSVIPSVSFVLCSNGPALHGDYIDWVGFADLPDFTPSF